MTDTLTIHTEAGPLELPAGATLADALRRLLPGDEAEQAEAAARLATAVNGDFVPRNQRASAVSQARVAASTHHQTEKPSR